MNAPETAYHTEKANFDTTTTEVDVYIAKFLENTTPPTGDDWGDGYFNSTDDDATRKSKILSIFKLDGLFRGKTTLKEGFIGYVRISPTPSTNASYHASGRFSGRKLTDQATGYTYELFNDAGLNTKGDTILYSVLSNNATDKNDSPLTYPPRINDLAVWAYFRSAFYTGSERYIQIQNPFTLDWINVKIIGSLAAKLYGTAEYDLWDNTIIERAGEYIFRSTIENTEGTFVSGSIIASILRAFATMKYNNIYASYAYTGSTTRGIYYDTKTIVSTQGGVEGEATSFAKNDVIEMGAGDIADYGFYTLGDVWYEFGLYVPENKPLVLRTGICAAWSWPPDDPAYRFYPVFYDTIQYQFEEIVLTVTTKTLTLTSGTENYSTTPPNFPNASYSITLNCSIALPNTNVYFYIQTESSSLYYLGSGNTGGGSTNSFSFSGNFSTLGLLPYAGDQYYILITDTFI